MVTDTLEEHSVSLEPVDVGSAFFSEIICCSQVYRTRSSEVCLTYRDLP